MPFLQTSNDHELFHGHVDALGTLIDSRLAFAVVSFGAGVLLGRVLLVSLPRYEPLRKPGRDAESKEFS